MNASQVALRPAAFFAAQRIEWIAGRRAVVVDRTRWRVALDDDAVIEYDHLVFATGARNRTLSVPGVDLENVFFLRTLDEAALLRERARVLAVHGGQDSSVLATLELRGLARGSGPDARRALPVRSLKTQSA